MGPGEDKQTKPLTDATTNEERKTRGLFICEVRDMSTTQTSTKKIKFFAFHSLPISNFVKEVAQEFKYDPESFELVYQKKSGEIVILTQVPDTLACDHFASQPNSIAIVDKPNEKPRPAVEEVESQFTRRRFEHTTDIPTHAAGDSSSTHVPPPAPPPYSPNQSEVKSWGFINTSTDNDTVEFVGLVNQAMTCYLNSLLQTLYMTPEFRNALYRWEFVGNDDEGIKSVPFQLQKLFLLLQTSGKPAVGTTQLTTSFGWDSSEAWQQHDVQELCRVMFDALEQTFQNTEQSDLFSTLYEGKMKDYVKCLECGYESAREDTFLDIPLVVRPFGSSEAYGSVEEALQAFVTPETLYGSNQYFCERCNKKCDAHKGLKFLKFPYLLTLQLKRFDFDPHTMHRIKLNDKVTFPEILSINEFIKTEKGDSSIVNTDCVNACKTEKITPNSSDAEKMEQVEEDEGIDIRTEGLSKSMLNDEESDKENIKPSVGGPYIYELFSIMVHSGSANGGHYYAYIKSFKDKEWYCFNDAQVTRITNDDIEKTYGGGSSKSYYSSAYLSSVNAYMLMYRQIDGDKNAEFMSTEVFPNHIKILLRNMIEQEERERQLRELERYMCKIKLFCLHPTQDRMIEMKLKVHKDTTLAEATATARSIMSLDSVVPLDCCRLVKYDDLSESIECSFENSEGFSIGYILGGVRTNYKHGLFLEIKQPHETFQEYKPGGISVKVHVVDLEKEEVSPTPILVRSYITNTICDLTDLIAETLGVTASSLRLVMEKFGNELQLLPVNSANLRSLGFGRNTKLFVEFQDEEDFKLPFEESKLHLLVDSYILTICIQVALPKVDKGILEKLSIHEDAILQEDLKSGENDADAMYKSNPEQMPSETANDGECELNNVYEKLKFFVSQKKKKDNKKNNFIITPDDSSQDCDEGLGDSEIGDSCSTADYQSSHAVHSDQSEDSSLTDSERTLVGYELSPRNNSPTLLGNEIDVDIEHSSAFSPDISRPDYDSAHSSSDSNFQADEQAEDLTNPSSPEEIANDPKYMSQTCGFTKNKRKLVGQSSDNAREVSFYVKVQLEEFGDPTFPEKTDRALISRKNGCKPRNGKKFTNNSQLRKRYFRAWPYTDSETEDKMLRVYVDKRITLAALKKELEPFIGVRSEYFKVFKVYSNNQEFECTSLTESLMSYTDDLKLIVKLDRPLREGEYKVKIYQLCINDSEPCKFLMECIFAKGASVLQTKKDNLPEIQRLLSLNVPLHRCRLRKKSWKNPGTVFLDHQRFDLNIPINSNWEVFLQILEDDEPVFSDSQVSVFLKRWNRSSYTLDKFQEVILESSTIDCLLSKISEVSGIPKEQVEIAKGSGAFPCDVSLVSIDSDLDWQLFLPNSADTYEQAILDDGKALYYRDSQEELKKLSDEERREIINKENARCNKMQKTSFSPRKERALKIYTLDSAPKKSNTSCSTSSSIADKVSVPDLD